jgi:hypothetical protein
METADTLLAHIQTSGMLLHHDPVLLSLTTLVANGSVTGSWWAHPQAQRMYTLINTLTEHSDLPATEHMYEHLAQIQSSLAANQGTQA